MNRFFVIVIVVYNCTLIITYWREKKEMTKGIIMIFFEINSSKKVKKTHYIINLFFFTIERRVYFSLSTSNQVNNTVHYEISFRILFLCLYHLLNVLYKSECKKLKNNYTLNMCVFVTKYYSCYIHSD